GSFPDLQERSRSVVGALHVSDHAGGTASLSPDAAGAGKVEEGEGKMKRNSIIVCALAAMVGVFTGCGGGGDTKTAEQQPAAAEGGAVYQPTGDEGTVTGKVAFPGPA